MCLSPFRASQSVVVSKSTGMPDYFGTPKASHEGTLSLPCGKCFECITKRTQEWATRASHEISTHKENCFLTLTYDNQNLPNIEDFQKKIHIKLFIKRLRKSLGSKKIKYIASHEFGGKTFRPHHHLIIFGWSPANQKLLKETPSGFPLFTSPHLEKQWLHGFSSVADANTQTSYYVASYALKGKKHTYTNDNGEIITVSDSMTASQGIGLKYATENIQQLIDSKKHLPRYYKKKLLEENPTLHQQYEDNYRNPRITSDHEKYAKLIINERKKTNSNDTYREDTNDEKYTHHYIKYLKQIRSNYATKTGK